MTFYGMQKKIYYACMRKLRVCLPCLCNLSSLISHCRMTSFFGNVTDEFEFELLDAMFPTKRTEICTRKYGNALCDKHCQHTKLSDCIKSSD